MKKIPFITAVIIVVAAVTGGILIFQNRNSSDRDRQYEKQEPVGLSYDDCKINTDCVLVQEKWCKTVLAVNKTKEVEWREDSAKQTEIAQRERQTCKLMPEEYLDMKNFRAVCKQSECLAEFNGDLTR